MGDGSGRYIGKGSRSFRAENDDGHQQNQTRHHSQTHQTFYKTKPIGLSARGNHWPKYNPVRQGWIAKCLSRHHNIDVTGIIA
jgi:hypothetical protein